MWLNCSCTAENVAANSSSTCAVSSLMSASRSSMDFSRSRRCSRRKEARSDSSAHSASASGLTGPMRSRRRVRRSTRSRSCASSASSAGGANPAWSSCSLTSSSAGGELVAAVVQPGERDLHLGAALAGLLELPAQLRLVVGELAQLAALQAGALVVADVELRDETRGVRPQGAGARLDGRAGLAHGGDLLEAPVELRRGAPGRR